MLIRPFWLILFFWFPSVVLAGGIQEFQDFVKNARTLEGEFVQQQIKKSTTGMNVTKESSGVFRFKRPGQFIWAYQQPYEQILQADGQQFYIYDKDLNQVTIKKTNEALSASPMAILLGGAELEKEFTFKEIGVKNGLMWIDATPKRRDGAFERIGIGLYEGAPQAMELYDMSGKTSLVTFKKIKRNVDFSKEVFKFKRPKGVDVIKN
jgi:outer membrane lipoprotein carrier protein